MPKQGMTGICLKDEVEDLLRSKAARAPLTDQDFLEGMENGYFVEEPQHPGLVALLHYSAVRITEGLNASRRQFLLTQNTLFYDVGERLKHSHKTEPLPLPLNAPYVSCIVDSLKDLEPEERVWPYCRKRDITSFIEFLNIRTITASLGSPGSLCRIRR